MAILQSSTGHHCGSSDGISVDKIPLESVNKLESVIVVSDEQLTDRGAAETVDQVLVEDEIKISDNAPTSQAFSEGGWGWVNIFAMFSGNASIFGIFSQFFTDNATFQGVANTALSIISVLMTVSVDFCAPLTGALADKFGFRLTMASGALLALGGQIVASLAQSDTVWPLFFGSLVTGIGFSGNFAPAIGIPSQCFKERLGLATAIGLSGTGVGGMVLSPVTQLLIDYYGWRTAWRVIGFVGCACLVATAMLVRMPHQSRRTRHERKTARKAPSFDVAIFRNKAYWKLSLMSFCAPCIYSTPYLFIPQQVQDAAAGSTPSVSGATCLLILNLCFLIGQLSAGVFVKRFGPYNMLWIF
ncbi:hypothetical protein HDU93_003170, partial [Gonapodya sp. JEL0774]